MASPYHSQQRKHKKKIAAVENLKGTGTRPTTPTPTEGTQWRDIPAFRDYIQPVAETRMPS